MTAPTQYTDQNLYVPPNGRMNFENGGASASQLGPIFKLILHKLHHCIPYQQNPNGLANGMRYPATVPMHQPMPMIQHSYQHTPSADGPYQRPHLQSGPQKQERQGQADGGRNPTGSSGLPKVFTCSICNKGFARRSDLACHGMSLYMQSCASADTNHQSVATAASDLMCATILSAASSPSNAPLSRSAFASTPARSYKCLIQLYTTIVVTISVTISNLTI